MEERAMGQLISHPGDLLPFRPPDRGCSPRTTWQPRRKQGPEGRRHDSSCRRIPMSPGEWPPANIPSVAGRSRTSTALGVMVSIGFIDLNTVQGKSTSKA